MVNVDARTAVPTGTDAGTGAGTDAGTGAGTETGIAADARDGDAVSRFVERFAAQLTEAGCSGWPRASSHSCWPATAAR